MGRWKCKLCNGKQSYLPSSVFGHSEDAKEIRQLVQRLNRRRGELQEEKRRQEEENDNKARIRRNYHHVNSQRRPRQPTGNEIEARDMRCTVSQ